MNRLIQKINEEKDTYGYSHQHLAQFVVSNQKEVANMTITNLAKNAYCSPSSVSRFVKKLGFNSYYEFTKALKTDTSDYVIDEGIIRSFKIVDEFYNQNEQVINELVKDMLDSEKIYFFATGQSAIPVIDFTRKFERRIIDKVVFSSDENEQLNYLKDITDKDYVIFVSNSGEGRELINFTKKIPNYTLITNRSNSTLSRRATNIISLDNHIESSIAFKMHPRESKYSIIYFFDKLFILLKDNYIPR